MVFWTERKIQNRRIGFQQQCLAPLRPVNFTESEIKLWWFSILYFWWYFYIRERTKHFSKWKMKRPRVKWWRAANQTPQLSAKELFSCSSQTTSNWRQTAHRTRWLVSMQCGRLLACLFVCKTAPLAHICSVRHSRSSHCAAGMPLSGRKQDCRHCFIHFSTP